MMMARTKGAISKDRIVDAEELRHVLKPIYDKLVKAGVSEARLPTNEALVSKIVNWVDTKKIDAWVQEYAKLMR
jgi:hypothetical protein